MSERFTNFRVGLFVLSALVILIVGSLWILGSSAIVGERVPYTVVLDDSGAVEVGDRVRLAGVSVGRIQGIRLRPLEQPPVLIDIDVRSEIELHEGTTATISTVGLLGAAFLQLVPGPASAPRLAPGGVIEGGAASGFDAALGQVDLLSEKLSGVLDQVSGLLRELSGDIDPVLANLEVLASEDNAESLSAILASAESTLSQVETRIGPLLDDLETMTANFSESSEGLPELTAEIASLVESVNKALGPDGRNIESLLAAAEGTLGNADEALAVIGDNRETLEQMLLDMQSAMANLDSFSRQVRQRPSSLIRGGGAKDRRPGDPP
ncbi:MAG: MlaD family protein, partial [Thermoanaerobaculia bacterium]|nr:MlaD family protein [Thermoanaerobaculia bacterium]